ncbi:MAG: DUF3108 domain-containing protein [Chthoniobacterales bacterium]
MISPPLRARLLALLVFAVVGHTSGQDWQTAVSPYAPGVFPELRPMHARYGFGWNTLTAAEADFRLTKTADGRQQLEATGHTIGLARKLWSFDVTHVSLTDARSLRPIQVRETELVRSKKFVTEVNFTPPGVVSKRDEESAGVSKSKTHQLDFPNLNSIDSALLYLRTQSLKADAPQRIVVYPSTSAYLCTLTPLGREKITVPAGSYEAIKLDLQLNKIDKKLQLAPHKRFHRATIWISDDPNRMVLRIEAQIFVGTVFAELHSLQFDDARP